MSYTVLNILDIIKDSGEDNIKEALSAFLCPLNTEIETFARSKAIDFAKKETVYIIYSI